MSVILEFTVASEQFTLGRITAGLPPARIELERIVPTGSGVAPFLWVTGPAKDALGKTMAYHPSVEDVVVLDATDAGTLYRVAWRGAEDDLVQCIGDADGAVLEAYGGNAWRFHLRLPDHDRLSAFYACCTECGISIDVERTYSGAGRPRRAGRFGLSQAQREALELGLREGYFDTPSDANLSELAAELGISQQALSNRIRRGAEKVLRTALADGSADRD